MSRQSVTLIWSLAATGALLASRVLAAQPPSSGTTESDAQLYRRTVDRAIGFLQTKGQDTEGAYAKYAGPGVTAIVTTAILRNGRTPNDPLVAKSLKYLERFVQPNGGIYQPGSLYQNYETCLAMLCFSEANRDGRYDKALKGAERFLKGEQWGDKQGLDQSNPSYGGAGYGKHQRPDLSNTQFFVEALRAAGDGPDDPAIQKALVFISRCQNFESPHNATGLAALNPDGGFYYTAAAGGESQAGKTPNGGLRSYGSMTYAGLKSMIYAGVGPDDPRVKAAVAWIKKFYALDANPGIGSAGLYYYYHTFAKALDAVGQEVFVDESGVKHPWRSELLRELVRRQRPDGSWINENNRWLEGDPCLVMGYALLTLAYCRPAAGKN